MLFVNYDAIKNSLLIDDANNGSPATMPGWYTVCQTERNWEEWILVKV